MKLSYKQIFFSILAITLTYPVAVSTIPKPTQDIVCLAQNIYYEARGESLLGKLAVAKVTLNRVDSGKFASSICGVVYQPRQFSWTNEVPGKITELAAWRESLDIAHIAVENGIEELEDFTAMYYHNNTVKPKWRRKVYAKIGKHIFYE